MSDEQACASVEPTENHRWLRRMIGSWEYEMAWVMEPGGEPGIGRGAEIVRPFGDLWIVGEGKGTTPDGTAMDWVISLGFDPQRPMGEADPAGRYIGTFLATVMPGMFVYEGTREGEVLTLETEGPSMGDPAFPATYRDVIEQKGDDLRVMTSNVRMPDGSWFGFMRGEYRRVD
jgi:hypothetical protein